MSSVMEIAMKEMGQLIELATANLKVLPGPIVNVSGYGAVGDGVTNDTTVVQTAIDYALANGMKAVFFPRGTNGQYYVTALTNANQVVLFGDNSSFVGGYTGTILQIGEGGVTQADLDAVEATINTVDSNLNALEADYAKEVGKVVNITGYGAIGDGGVTDCTNAIKLAIAACPPGGKVLIPPAANYYKVLLGEIVIDKTISFEGLTSGDDQNGGDVNSCRLVFFPNGVQTEAIKITASGVNLKNFTMFDASASGNGHFGIKATSMLNITTERVWIRAFDYPVKFDDCIQCTFRQVNIRDCVTGFRFETLGTSMLLEQCWVQNPSSFGYVFNNQAYCTLLNCLVDGNPSSPAAQPDSAISLQDCNTINIVGCASERTKKSHINFQTCEDVTVLNYFGVNGNMNGAGWGHSFAFIQGSGKNIVFINPRDYQPTAGTVASITKSYVGTSPIIIGGTLPSGYNDAGAIITVPTGAILVGMAGIVEDAFYLKASDTGVRKKLTVNGANVVTAVNG